MSSPVAIAHAPAPTPQDPQPAPAGLVYRPALDGLRSVAVYLVVAFHAGSSTLIGGFIGVDLFFVLSGYLVTRVILTDMARGSYALVDFYGRRVRRLLPAALLTLVLVAVAWLTIASPADRVAILDDARAAALYVSNWHFAQTATDYFAANDNPTPLLHFWSLSVEEQFYLFWPLALLLVWRASGRDLRRTLPRVRGLAIGGAVLSLVALAVTVQTGHTALAYYGTHTRAYQLLGGALLAVGVQRALLSRHRSRARAEWLASPLQVLCLGAVLVLATSRVTVGPSVRGVAVTLAAVGLLATLERRPEGPAARVLSLAPLTFLGKISYGTYLWHYPVLVVLRRFATMSPLTLTLLGALLATALAALSYQLLELPIRHSKALGRHAKAVSIGGLVASLGAAVVLLPVVLNDPRLPAITPPAGVSAAAVAGAKEDPRVVPVPMVDFDVKAASAIPAGSPAGGPSLVDPSCTKVPLEQCVAVRGTGKRVLLLGDSHASMLLPAMRAVATREQATLVLASRQGCPWQRTLLYVTGSDEECNRLHTRWYDDVVRELDPDVIVLATRATDHKIGGNYRVKSTTDGAPEGTADLVAAATRTSLTALARPGRLLVVIEPVPVGPQHSASCLSGVRFASACAFSTEGVSPLELAYRALAAERRDVRSVDLDPLICPRLPVCDPIIAGFVVRRDHDHLTAAWSAYLADDLDRLLRTAKVF